MALQLIIGSSGSGKSHKMYTDLIEKSMAFPKEQFIIIVPEQYTMETQKNIVTMHPRHGVMNIDIVSFGRLAHRIFEEQGKENSKVLEDTGKRMVIRKVLEEKKGALNVFGGSVRKSGFCGELKSMISELCQYNVTPKMLQDCLEQMDEGTALYGKVRDLSTVYEGFRKFIEGKFLTAEEILECLVPLVAQSDILKGSHIYLDNFTGFTPSQYHLLEELLVTAKEVVMTLTIDVKDKPYELGQPYELFYLTKETLYRLEKLCKKIGCQRKDDVFLNMTQDHRFGMRTDLKFMEQNIFRKTAKNFEELPEHVQIYQALNPGAEATFCAKQIRRLVRDEGYRYKDIAVLTGDVAGYRYLIEKEFKTMDIPCFIDTTRSVLGNAFVETLRALLNMFVERFSYESVFRYLRAAFCDISREDVDLLENYARAFGIRGVSGWNNIWTKRPARMDDAMLLALNQIREAAFEKIWPLYEVFSDKHINVGAKTRALMDWLQDMDMQTRLNELSKGFEEKGQLSEALEFQQIYDVVFGLLKKMADILDDEHMPMREYMEVLDAGFNELKLGLIPPGKDACLVGDIQRTRLSDIKILLFIGVNEGIVPAAIKDGGIINDREKELLSTLDVELSPTSRQMGYFEQYYIYAALCRASHKIIITYAQNANGGKQARPSSLIRRIMRLFPKLTIESCENNEHWSELLYNEDTAFEQWIKGLGQIQKSHMKDSWMELYSWFFNQENYKDKIKGLLDAAFISYMSTPLSKAAVHALYGDTLENSITTLENFASCAYAHFLGYALRLSEREEHRIQSPDLGLVFHKALELFAKELKKSGYSWRDVPEDVREQLSIQCADAAAKAFDHTALLETKRNQYQIRRLTRYILRTTWALKRQLAQGDFEPEAFELKFDSDALEGLMDVSLAGQMMMKLKGTIDRIDVCEDDDNVYVKVVDYKSGGKKFNVAALYHGLSLQLVVYMNAAGAYEEKKHPGKQVIPAGILYYNIDDPMLDDKDAGMNDTLDVLDDMRLSKLRCAGVVNGSMDIIRHMDKDFDGDSKVIPVSLNKDGSLSKKSSVLSQEKLNLLGDYAQVLVQHLGEEILSGKIDINPYTMGTKCACTYCQFKSVCGFDENISGYDYRKLNSTMDDSMWEAMEIMAKGDEHNGSEMDR